MLNKIFVSIFSLFSGSLVGQLIHVLVLPFLSALFSQEEIGAFFLFQAIVVMGTVFVTLQSELAIVVESNEQSYNCYKKSVLIVFASVLFVCFFLPFTGYLPDWIFSKVSFHEWLLLIPIALLVNSLNIVHEYLFTHEKRFRLISVLRVAKPVTIYLFVLLFWYIPGGKHNLIAGFVAGSGFVLIWQIWVAYKDKRCRFNRSDFTVDGFKWYFKKYRKILIFNTVSSGIVTASMQMPYLFISTFYGERFSAWYGMSMRLIGMPLGLLGQSMGQVYFQKFALISYHKHAIFPLAKKLVRNLYLSGILPFVLLMLFTPLIYTVFLRQGWEQASILTKVLLPWLFVLMVSAPVSQIIPIIGMQQKTIYYDIALFIARFMSLYMCSIAGMDFIVTMAVFSGLGMVFNLFFQAFILYLARKFDQKQ